MSVWLILLSIIPLYPLSLPVLSPMARFPSFFMAESIPFYSIFFNSPSINGNLGYFHILAIINNTAVSIEVHISFWISVFVFFRKILWSGISGSCNSSNFLRNPIIVFHSDFTNLSSHQQYRRVPFCPCPCQWSLFVSFLIIAILIGIWY